MLKGSFVDRIRAILPEESREKPRRMCAVLAGGKEVPIRDPARGEDPVVLLVGHRARVLQHGLRRRRVPRTTGLAN